MTTGSLKFISLLVVIAAGGGVVWQVQQGILHTNGRTAGSDADRDADTADDDADIDDLFADDTETASSDVEPTAKLSFDKWDDEQQESPRRAAGAPEKFQRTPTKSPAISSAIPPRKPAAHHRKHQADDIGDSPADLAEAQPSELSVNDPLTEQDDPSEDKTSRRRTFTASSESDSRSADDRPGRPRLNVSETETSDPFDESPAVMLVGNDHADENNDSDLPPTLNTDAASATDAEVDDPFAGAAPPEIEGETASDTVRVLVEESSARDDEPSSGPALAPSGRDAVKKKSPRSQDRLPTATDKDIAPSQRKDIAPSQRKDIVPSRKQHDPAELQPKLGLPTITPSDSSDEDRGPDTDGPKASPSRRSKRTPKHSDATSTDPSPRLLPVPDAPAAKKTMPSLPTDLDSMDREEPELGRTGRIEETLKEDELSGDGTPDRGAPQGMQQPRLTIEKIAPKQAVIGQPLIYSVVVKNVGSADAQQVTVEDRIPKGTKLEGTSPRAELIDKRLVWRLGTLKPEEQKKISIKLIPLEQGPIGSVAKVNFVAEIAAEIEVTAPQILVSIDAPSQVRLGEKLHLVFKVRNSGRADAQNVVVRNLIPDGLRHPAGADLEYALGTLPAQDAREIMLDLIATKNGTATNKTIITADGVHLEEDTPVEVIGEQLLLTRTGKNRLYVGKPAVFTSTVANEGTAPAMKVMVAEVVPAGFDFVSASDNGRFDPVTRAVTWSIGPIGPNEEMKLSTKLMPKKLGDYRATVTVTGPAGSVATVDAELKVDGFPAVAVESKSDARLISVGETATIRIQCKNQGTAAAKNLMLSAELPPELKLVDGNGPSAWARQGNVITFEAISSLDPNESATFEVQVEGLAEGDTRIELQISGDHLKRPLHRDETIRVAPEAE